uniref:Uncharacterized protein n=1 Tax=viral metagenome TaxID=1070528 RepID=A0A6C0AEV2_9ZZZZ
MNPLDNIKKFLNSEKLCLCLEKYIENIDSDSHEHFYRASICNIPFCESEKHKFFEKIIFENIIFNNPLKLVQCTDNGFFMRHSLLFSPISFIRNINDFDYENFIIERKYSSTDEGNSHIYEKLDSYLEIDCNCEKKIIEKLLEYKFNPLNFRDFVLSIFNSEDIFLKFSIIDSFFSVLEFEINISKDKSFPILVKITDGFYQIA